jgi:hypothetical protein
MLEELNADYMAEAFGKLAVVNMILLLIMVIRMVTACWGSYRELQGGEAALATLLSRGMEDILIVMVVVER